MTLSIINVNAERFGDHYYVSCREIPGISIIGDNLSDLFNAVPFLVKKIFKDNYKMDVCVSEVSEAKKEQWQWAIAEAAGP